MRLQLDAYNLFNVKANQIEYYLRVPPRHRAGRRRHPRPSPASGRAARLPPDAGRAASVVGVPDLERVTYDASTVGPICYCELFAIRPDWFIPTPVAVFAALCGTLTSTTIVPGGHVHVKVVCPTLQSVVHRARPPQACPCCLRLVGPDRRVWQRTVRAGGRRHRHRPGRQLQGRPLGLRRIQPRPSRRRFAGLRVQLRCPQRTSPSASCDCGRTANLGIGTRQAGESAHLPHRERKGQRPVLRRARIRHSRAASWRTSWSTSP